MAKRNEKEKQNVRGAKAAIMLILGEKCCRCGFNDPRALQFDHISGGGVRERKRTGNKRYHYRKILREMAQGVYRIQVLCANCNWIKRYENDETGRPRPEVVSK